MWGHFPKSILDVAWGELLQRLAYKAEEAGKFAVAVAPQSERGGGLRPQKSEIKEHYKT